MFYKEERLALFIDGVNMHSTARALGFDIDYKMLREEFVRRGRLQRISYYTAVPEGEDYSPVRPLIDWLDYNGYAVRTKMVREYTDTLTGRKKSKSNMNVEIVVDALDLAPRLDHVVLFTGDGEMTSLVASLQRRGCRVSVVSSIASNPSVLSDDLRRQADCFIDLNDLRDVIGKPESRPEN